MFSERAGKLAAYLNHDSDSNPMGSRSIYNYIVRDVINVYHLYMTYNATDNDFSKFLTIPISPKYGSICSALGI